MTTKVGQYILESYSSDHVSYTASGELDHLSPAAIRGLLYSGLKIEDWVSQEWEMDESQDSVDFIEFWRQVRLKILGG